MRNSPVPKSVWVVISLILLIALPSAAAAQPAGPTVDLSSLNAVSVRPVSVTWDAHTGVPAFVAGQFPSRTTAQALIANPLGAARSFLAEHRTAFGMASPARDLRLVRAESDELSMTHVRLQQTYRGVPVLGAEMLVHFDPTGGWVTTVNGDYLPGLKLPTTKPSVEAGTALKVALAALPGSLIQQPPELVVADGRLHPALSGSNLTWLVELYDPRVPARNVYLVDAHTGLILDSYDRLTTERNRLTYTAGNRLALPGTLWLNEAGPVSGQSPDDDGLQAHEFAGATYDYYALTHTRDSYDDNGATLTSTVHYGNNFENAFWNGTQMVYGDGFASANDVVAHELTHAVTEFTANLVYRYQSGALNESFSDIFGAMVDHDDWLMGEDLPIGAIRSLEDPPAYGDPDHLDNYDTTCADNGGVHTNSGIPNKVAYLLSEAIGRPEAEKIFYRTLVHYLTSNSEFNDALAAALQAAEDLYGVDSDEVKATGAAFLAVGLDGVSTPPDPDCDCPTSLTLKDRSLFEDVNTAVRIATTVYRTRDDLMRGTPAGQRYVDLYYAHAGEISRLLAKDPALRAQAADLLRTIVPGLAALLDGRGDEVVVTPATIRQLDALLNGLAQADRGGALAKTIAAERARLKLEGLAGLTFEEAWEAIDTAK